uniref:S-adenosyl-L-methionine-dependent methyltransferases superfamily isoform 1 n=1 Tax=Bixa orellana TaxID=66672 RepID=A0A9Y1EIE8_BIXOR|nr:S-adenosyl-L-methionine-dependent methyltransferases superfamily isoform 1 [Bixa orellana]QTZ19632.1 S-adenosyl-L-methionine-dependent methyltransferases superfamily isoform 1 [Bixa orellana]
MGFTMGLNLLLLLAMVATNLLSLYHLSSTLQSPKPPTPTQSPVPDHLLHQLRTIRATITHLARHHPSATSSTTKPSAVSVPQDLLLHSHLSPIASSCHNHPDLLHRYMNYTPFSLCPHDTDIQETLILNGCHPLPRRRCFSKTPPKTPSSLPLNPFPTSLPDASVIWSKYNCKSFLCLSQSNPNLGFDLRKQRETLVTYSSELDLPIPQFMQLANSANSVIRLGIDIGGGTGTFAAVMKEDHNVTVVTTTMNINAPYNEAVALRGLVPLHVPLQQRLPAFDGAVDLVRCGRAVNRWIPAAVLEFMLYDVDRVLRGGGYFWVDRFFSKRVDLEKVYGPLIGKLGYKKVKWAVANKTDSSGLKNGEVYLTALLQKPVSK